MLVLPAACFVLRNFGPAGRVVFYDYLPLDAVAGYAFALALGLSLGAHINRRLNTSRDQPRLRILTVIHSVGLTLLSSWALWPTLHAFPAHADMVARDRWARGHVRHYAALTRVIAAIPQLQSDLGAVTQLAPTADAEHRSAVEMNGDDMIFTFDVRGPNGKGVFDVNCTLDDERVIDWRSGRWRFAGRELRIDAVARQVP